MSSKKVVVGLSGGVDSSTAAYLLKKDGYDVSAVTVVNFNGGEEAAKDAAKVAQYLSINHVILDYKKIFKEKIKDMFVNEYLSGRTPNPCLICNREVKWGALMKVKEDTGADYIATGHYARVVKYGPTGRLAVKMSDDITKDQTYILSYLTQQQLMCTIFPLGGYTKKQVREIAGNTGIMTSQKPDSQEICFIPDKDYAAFIQDYTGKESISGNYVDMQGNVIGRHKGIIHYTIGQRKGLGVSFGRHMFVNSINAEKNEIVLGSNEELFKKEVYADKINFMAIEDIKEPLRAEAKIRYAHKKAACTVYPVDSGFIKCVFDEPQRAAAPGQAVVVYDGDYCLLSGIIEKKPKNSI